MDALTYSFVVRAVMSIAVHFTSIANFALLCFDRFARARTSHTCLPVCLFAKVHQKSGQVSMGSEANISIAPSP